MAKVKNFKIWNANGEIHFLGETDLISENLDANVIIKPKCVEVYPQDMFHGALEKLKPEIGQKLNRKSIVTFNNVVAPESLSDHQFIKLLKKRLETEES